MSRQVTYEHYVLCSTGQRFTLFGEGTTDNEALNNGYNAAVIECQKLGGSLTRLTYFNYTVVINNCDNRIVVELNGTTVYDKYYNRDPNLDDYIDITRTLKPYPETNTLVIHGHNGKPINPGDGGPWHFHYRVELSKEGKRDVLANVHVTSAGAHGPSDTEVMTSSHDIVKYPLDVI